MSEHEEIDEHIQHAHDPFDKLVAGTMATIAALLAIVSVLGQHYNTEMLLNQQQASDEWAFYQAKNIRRYEAQLTQDVITQVKGSPEAIAKYKSDGERYEKDLEGLKEKAEDLQKERDAAERRAKRFHIGEVFLEIGIVLSSLAILSKRKPLFFGGGASAALGIVLAATGFFV